MDQTLPAPWLRARFQRSRPRNEKRSRLPMRREKGRCRAFRYRYAVDMPRRDAASLADTLRSGSPFAVCARTSAVEALRASALSAERRAESATTSAGISFGRVRSMSSSSWARTCNSFTRTSSDVVWTRRRSSPHRKCPRGGRRMGKVYTWVTRALMDRLPWSTCRTPSGRPRRSGKSFGLPLGPTGFWVC